MTKSDLVAVVARKAGVSLLAAETVVDEIFDAIAAAFQRDEGVYIRRFGSLVIRHYKPYAGRNPKTGAVVQVRCKRLPILLVSEEMRRRMNKGNEPLAKLVHTGPGAPRRSVGITGVWDCVDSDHEPRTTEADAVAQGKRE
jgi:nucleoid DNA-binding protein